MSTDPEEPDPIAVMWRHVIKALEANKNPSPRKVVQCSIDAGCEVSSTTIAGWFEVWPTKPKQVVPHERTFKAFIRALGAEKDYDWEKLWNAASQARSAERRACIDGPELVPPVASLPESPISTVPEDPAPPPGTTHDQPVLPVNSPPLVVDDPPADLEWQDFNDESGRIGKKRRAGVASKRWPWPWWVGGAAGVLTLAVVGVIVRPTPGGTPPLARDRCSLVTAETSPVFVNLDDTNPLKQKYFNDRVTLVDRRKTVGTVAFQAVRLPAAGESPTGHGWMRANDLVDTPCEGSVQPLSRPK